MDKNVPKVAAVNKQPHGPAHNTSDAKQAAQHNRDLAKVERLHQRVFKK